MATAGLEQDTDIQGQGQDEMIGGGEAGHGDSEKAAGHDAI